MLLFRKSQCSNAMEYTPTTKALSSLDATSEQKLSGMPVVPFSFGGRPSNAEKWVTLEPHQNLPPHCLRMTLLQQLVSHTILAWRSGKHSLLEQHYVHLFLYEFVHCYLTALYLNFVSGQFLRMSDQFWLCRDIGLEQLLDVIGRTVVLFVAFWMFLYMT